MKKQSEHENDPIFSLSLGRRRRKRERERDKEEREKVATDLSMETATKLRTEAFVPVDERKKEKDVMKE